MTILKVAIILVIHIVSLIFNLCKAVDFSSDLNNLEEVISQFPIKLTKNRLIGQGGESWVFAQSDNRVLRIYKPNAKNFSDVKKLQFFYEDLRNRLNYIKLPKVIKVFQQKKYTYTIEEYIHGVNLSQELSKLDDNSLVKVLNKYFDVLDMLHTVTYTNKTFGETTLLSNSITTDDWKDFVQIKIEQYLKENKLFFIKNGLDINKLKQKIDINIKRLFIDAIEKNLVHGDMSPENIMFDPVALKVTAIIDFNGKFSIIGDKRIDICSSIFFLPLIYENESMIVKVMRDIISIRYPFITTEIINFYEVYYALKLLELSAFYHEINDWCYTKLEKYITKS